jgi:tetratricopeptide (TPR) repeat protein
MALMTQTPAFRAQLLYAKSWLTGGELALKDSAVLLEQALALVRPLGEDQAPGREKILFGLADNWMLLGRGAESEALYRELLAEQVQRHGSEHARTNVTRMGLGTALMQLGRNDEARGLLEQAQAALTRTLGPGHRLTLNARDGLATLRFKAGHFDAAAAEWAQVRSGFVALMGADSSYTLTAQTNQAMALQRAGQSGAAEALLRDALARARKNLKNDSPQVQQIRYTLADVLLDQRKPAEVPALIEGLDAAALNEAQQEADWPARLATLHQRLS